MKLYKETHPAVSIILPTFNRQNLLIRAVESVLKQTFTAWELIIVDDGSTDKTFDIVSGFMKKTEKIRYLRHSNRKLPLTLNAGILASAGFYITFLGSDDEYKEEHISLRMEYMNNNPSADLLYGGVEIIGDPYVKDVKDRTKLIHLSECVIGGTFFGKRKLFLDLEGFKDLDYSEDSEFFERAKLNYQTAKVNFPTYIYYRNTPDSICNTI